MSSNSLKIKNALVELLSGLELDGEPAFVGVADNTSQDFDGTPILRVLPDFIENIKGAMSMNDRSVNYQAVIHIGLEDPAAIPSEKVDQIYTLTDLVLDALDEGDYGNALQDIDPTLSTYIMKAERADWDVVGSGAGALLMMVVNISVSYSKDVSNGLS